jgi:hypothetical protein
LIKVATKLEKVVRAVPRMEAFIKEIGAVVDPAMATERDRHMA